jgi:hypothetical protein
MAEGWARTFDRPAHNHVHAADRSARGHLEFARAMKEAAN